MDHRPSGFQIPNAALFAVAACLGIGLAACGSGSSASASPQPPAQQPVSQAAADYFSILATTPGVAPFISLVEIAGSGVQDLAGVEFTIAPKPGSVSKAVHVHYSIAALSREHYLSMQQASPVRVLEGVVRLPVFGLYAGFQNQVLVKLDFQDGSTRTLPVVIATEPYADPNGIYDHPTVLVPRAAGSALGFDFFVMKSSLGSPVIVDTDAEIRWVAPGPTNSFTSAAVGDGFVIASPTAPELDHLGFDGSFTQWAPAYTQYTVFHHNIDFGKTDLLTEVMKYENGVLNVASTLVEQDPDGSVDNSWDLADIISTYMRSQGDDPSAFVRPGVDWFHMNASTYDPSDDSVIVSSRENFLIKVDYSTGNIIWILGDPTKYWYTFPSLRAKALTLKAGGLYPIGQHAVSITSDGLVMVFNDGFQSVNQPPGEPAGASRSYSAVSAYSIDPINRTAQEAWRFDYGQSIFSGICSSAYEASGASLLVDYAVADQGADARLVGLDNAHNVVFDFQYSSPSDCSASWNATPIALDNFSIL